MAGYEAEATYRLVAVTPLSVTLVVFQELTYAPSALACQQKVPAPSKLNGAVMVDVGVQMPVPVVAVGPTVGVRVKVGGTGVLVLVAVGPPAVGVRVGVKLGPVVAVLVRVTVRVGVFVATTGVIGVLVFVATPGVFVGPVPPVKGNS